MTSRFMGAAGNGVGALPMVDDVRSLPSLSPLRQCRHAVIVCVDDPAAYEAARDVFADLRAELVVESEPGAPFASARQTISHGCRPVWLNRLQICSG
jgi:hypothetical protein